MTQAANQNKPQAIMLVVGEASGDLHAAALLKELKKKASACEYFGMGGSLMRAEGFHCTVDSETEASVMGLSEICGNLRKIYRAFDLLVREAEKKKPELIIFLDFPDFNMRLAKKLHKRGFKTLYYIVPKVWAWRKWRVTTLKKYFDKLIAIFPFEKEFYQRNGANVDYVGNPFVDFAGPKSTKEEFFKSLGLSTSQPSVGLLPGSRKPEVRSLLPVLVEAFNLLKKEKPNLQAIIPVAHSIDADWLKSLCPIPAGVVLSKACSQEVLHSVDAVVAASGTVTLEATIAEVPFLVVYKLSKFSYFVGKTFIRGIKFISLTNIIAGKEIVKELIQDQANPESIATELKKLLDDSSYKLQLQESFRQIKTTLKLSDKTLGETACERAATIAIALARS